MRRQYKNVPKEENRPYRQLTPKDCNFLILPELNIDNPYKEIFNQYKETDMSMWWRLRLSSTQGLETPTFIRNYREVESPTPSVHWQS